MLGSRLISLMIVAGTLNITTLTLTIADYAFVSSGSLYSNASGTVIYNKAANGQNILIGKIKIDSERIFIQCAEQSLKIY